MSTTISRERLSEVRELLRELRAPLRGYISDYEQWLALTRDTATATTTAADRRIAEREERIASPVLLTLWQESIYEIRLEGAYDPWRVSLHAEGVAHGAGESHRCVSEAMADAIDGALEHLDTLLAEENQP